MSSTPNPHSGKLHWVQWPAETEGETSFRGGERLDSAQLVIASHDVTEVATRRIPDAVAVVHLPQGEPAAVKAALELTRQMVHEGLSVVWLQGPNQTSLLGTYPSDDDLSGIDRWIADQQTACESLDVEDARPRPLSESWVLLARSRRQAFATVRQLTELGATVVSRPAIAIGPVDDTAALDAALDRLESYDWLVFSSVNGVQFLIERLQAFSGNLRRLDSVKLAAIGPGTAKALAEHQLRADVVPDEYRAEALAEVLSNEAAGKRFLLARTSRGREVLAEQLLAAGADVEQVVVYQSTDVRPTKTQLRPVAQLLDTGRIDWTMVTSTAIARSLDRLFGRQLDNTRLAVISPVTTAALCELGHEPAVEAKQYTLDGLIEAMVAARDSDDKLI